jgi:ribose transport system permease protein
VKTTTVKRVKWDNPILIASLSSLLLLILGQMISPGFAKPSQIINLLTVAAFLGIVAGSQNLVILGGNSGIDLSVGQVVTIGAIIGGAVIDGQNHNVLLGLILVLISTFVIGMANGVGVTYLQIPPLVMTLGMGIIVAAISKFITGGVPVKGAPEVLRTIVVGKLFGIPGILYIWLLFSVSMILFLRNTRYGINLFSMGANAEASRLSGVSISRMRIITYGLSSMFSGLAGFLYLGYVGSVYNITLGDKYTLPSVVAVVIGGTSLAGGTGGYIGVLIGAILLQLLESILITINIEQFGRNIFFGIGLIILMLGYGRMKKLRQ